MENGRLQQITERAGAQMPDKPWRHLIHCVRELCRRRSHAPRTRPTTQELFPLAVGAPAQTFVLVPVRVDRPRD